MLDTSLEVKKIESEFVAQPFTVHFKKLGKKVDSTWWSIFREKVLTYTLRDFPPRIRSTVDNVVKQSIDLISRLGVPNMSMSISGDTPHLKIPLKEELPDSELVRFEEMVDAVFPNLRIEIEDPSIFFSDKESWSKVDRLRKDFFIGSKRWQYPMLFNSHDISSQDLHSIHILVGSDNGLVGSVRIPISKSPSTGTLSDRMNSLGYMASSSSLAVSPINGESVFENPNMGLSDESSCRLINALESSFIPTIERLCLINKEEFATKIKVIYPNLSEEEIKKLYYFYASKINSLLMACLSAICFSIGSQYIFVQTDMILKMLIDINFGNENILEMGTIQQNKGGKVEGTQEDACITYVIDLESAKKTVGTVNKRLLLLIEMMHNAIEETRKNLTEA